MTPFAGVIFFVFISDRFGTKYVACDQRTTTAAGGSEMGIIFHESMRNIVSVSVPVRFTKVVRLWSSSFFLLALPERHPLCMHASIESNLMFRLSAMLLIAFWQHDSVTWGICDVKHDSSRNTCSIFFCCILVQLILCQPSYRLQIEIAFHNKRQYFTI